MELAAAGVEPGDPPPPENPDDPEAFVFVDPGLDQDLMYIRIAEVLNCSPDEVGRKAAHWSGAALTLLEAREIAEKRQAAKKK